MQPTPPQSLPRVLGPWMATAIVVGTVIGSGVFKKAATSPSTCPSSAWRWASGCSCGLLALLGALAIAEVAVLFPRAGGNYVFLREAYGRMAGFLWGWVEFWIIRSASIAALATMFTDSFHDVLKQALRPRRDGRGARLLAAAAASRCRHRRAGRRERPRHATRRRAPVRHHHREGRVAAVHHRAAVRGAARSCSEPTYPPRVAHLRPTWPSRLVGDELGEVRRRRWSAVLWAYHGWMNIGPMAGEVKDPQRNIPLALIVGIGILIVLYCGANVAYYLVMPRDRDRAVSKRHDGRDRVLHPAARAHRRADRLGDRDDLGVRRAERQPARRPAAAVRDGQGRPRAAKPAGTSPALRHAGPRHVRARRVVVLLVLGSDAPVAVGLAALRRRQASTESGKPIKKSPFDVVTDFAMFGATTFETLAVASIFVFRRKIPPTPENRPYRCSGYPVVPALYVLIMARGGGEHVLFRAAVRSADRAGLHRRGGGGLWGAIPGAGA